MQPAELILVRVRSTCPVAHVPNVVEVTVANIRQNSRELAAAAQFPFFDFCEVTFIAQLRSARWVSDYAVIEVLKVKSSDFLSKMDHRLIPNKVQGGIEKSGAACCNEL